MSSSSISSSQLDTAIYSAVSAVNLELRTRNLHGIRGPTIGDPAQPADGLENLKVHHAVVLVNGVFPGPKAHALDNRQNTRLLAGSRPALEFLKINQLGLNGQDGFLHSCRLDDRGGSLGQTGSFPLRDSVWGVDGRCVGSFHEMFRDDVDHAFLRLVQILQGILGLVEGPHESHDEQGRIVVDDLRITERSEVGSLFVRGLGANEGDGPRHHTGDQELIIGRDRSTFCVRIDLDMILFQTLAPIIGTVALLPRWVRGLGESDFGILAEIRPGSLELVEFRADLEHGGGAGEGASTEIKRPEDAV